MFLTETGFTGTVDERIAWLDASVTAVEELRSGGVDVLGYTWWCLTDMMEWTYRYADGEPRWTTCSGWGSGLSKRMPMVRSSASTPRWRTGSER